jgi:hypothetical protein
MSVNICEGCILVKLYNSKCYSRKEFMWWFGTRTERASNCHLTMTEIHTPKLYSVGTTTYSILGLECFSKFEIMV